jgi:integrase/recombinase XerC
MNQLDFEKFLDDDEFESLKGTITSTPVTRNKLLIQLALATGARASELLALTNKSLIAKTNSVRIVGLKGSNDRDIPLNKILFKSLTQLPDGRLFDISYDRLYQIWLEFAPRKHALDKKLKTFHCLRHTCAVRLYKKTKDVKLVQMVLGHRDLRNTMIYVDFVYSQEKMREGMGV